MLDIYSLISSLVKPNSSFATIALPLSAVLTTRSGLFLPAIMDMVWLRCLKSSLLSIHALLFRLDSSTSKVSNSRITMSFLAMTLSLYSLMNKFIASLSYSSMVHWSMPAYFSSSFLFLMAVAAFVNISPMFFTMEAFGI